ncbi:hypothetical protein [Mycobacterium tilburgii]|uniref:hypothetical protein n=1 Tax=Mycobacterium tilburgii TaxID=44467 RepID=UPI0021B462FD|nr:hypothetical protein [Mycobacterium tilburgii]
MTETDLAEVGSRITFRHPLARSATYWSVSETERQAVHGALRKRPTGYSIPIAGCGTWPGPDENIAAELERSAAHALARGGLAAGADFLERAAILTLGSVRTR